MASLENLIPSIYHEKQQPGSMLCAQHALNNLLQGNYFSAPDLSEIASNLDALEHSYDGAHTGSTNMDDTGFFSVQVLENALAVWGLKLNVSPDLKNLLTEIITYISLTRWRGEAMRPYQDHPHTQLAFILNLQQHWFTLRRFGTQSNTKNDSEEGHWFNLNSFLSEPEWVGKLYLGMVLHQAETEGYSVFAVTRIDPSAPLGLPRVAADEIASTLIETSGVPPMSSAEPSTATSVPKDIRGRPEGLDDEDYELQAALQASLTDGQFGINTPPFAPPRIARSFTPLPPDDSEYFEQLSSLRSDTRASSSEEDELDVGEGVQLRLSAGEQEHAGSVAESMARSRYVLQRMREHQEYAQRELWGEGPPSEIDAAAFEERRAQRQREIEEEAEELRRAIAESEALAREEGHVPDDGVRKLDSNMDVNRSELEPLQGFSSSAGDRVYDDDDTHLQAALRASLENVPQGWSFPELPPQPAPSRPIFTPNSSSPVTVAGPGDGKHTEDAEDAESALSTEVDDDNISPNVPAEAVGVDELRRRRLARFDVQSMP